MVVGKNFWLCESRSRSSMNCEHMKLVGLFAQKKESTRFLVDVKFEYSTVCHLPLLINGGKETNSANTHTPIAWQHSNV